MADASPVPPTPPATEGKKPPDPMTRTRLVVLLSFLGTFLLLLILFRAVLFPFVMAIFLAYLLEPVVAWAVRGKTFGLRWSRGPTIVLMYALILGGAFFTGSCAISRAAVTVRSAVNALKVELAHTAEKARFVLMEDGKPTATTSTIVFPKGTRVVYDPPAGDRAAPAIPPSPPAAPPTPATAKPGRGSEDPARAVYRTWYAVMVEPGEDRADVILEPTTEPVPDGPAGNRLLDVAAVDLPAGLDISIEPLPYAKGLEVFFERHIIAPVAQVIERMTGDPFDPGVLREAIREESEQRGPKIGEHLGEWSTSGIFTVFRSVYTVILIFMLTAFLVIDRNRIAHFFGSLPPPDMRPGYHTLMRYVDRGLSGVIRGQLMICCVNGFLTWLGLMVFGIKYAAALGLVAGIFSLIPVFGTIASSVPIVLVALAGGGLHAGLIALGWIGLIHLLEANLFNPLIMGTNAEMHPVVIIFALLAGEHAFGIWGALLAVPTASILQSCFKFYRREIEGLPLEEPKLHGKWIRGILAKLKARRKPAPPPASPS